MFCRMGCSVGAVKKVTGDGGSRERALSGQHLDEHTATLEPQVRDGALVFGSL